MESLNPAHDQFFYTKFNPAVMAWLGRRFEFLAGELRRFIREKECAALEIDPGGIIHTFPEESFSIASAERTAGRSGKALGLKKLRE
ncbi:MAG: hypothetical protein LBU64_11045 [Planctomycetota bacterium]|jgi:hypothetical protein|nr:hypothetical protein [Planctomycetota bacterium]